MAKEGDLHPESGQKYEIHKAAEVGNIFPLNTKFTTAFNYKYTDENGDLKPVYMGSYGIGTTRVMGVIVEKFHDDRGIIWPETIAPFQVHLIGLDLQNLDIKSQAESVYKLLQDNQIEVLFDDREDVTAGSKFADADLIGCPIRLVVSKRTNGQIELKKRNLQESQLVSKDQLISTLKS